MKKAAFFTLGCKTNQYETNIMMDLFKGDGYEIVDFDSYADVYVINTCTVTNMSDRKSRQVIHKTKESNPNCILCVVGCYAQVAKDDLSKIEDVDIILGTNDRKDIVNKVNEFQSEKICEVNDIMSVRTYEEWGGIAYSDKARVEIKIQDGCDNFCSYCGTRANSSYDTNRTISSENDSYTGSQNDKPLKGGSVGFALTFCTHLIGLGIVGLILCLCLGDYNCKKASVITFLAPLIIIIAFFVFIAAHWR